MAFTQDSGSVNATPQAAAGAAGTPYPGGPISVVAGNANAVVTCPDVPGTGFYSETPVQRISGIRVGYYTAAQTRANAAFTAVEITDMENPDRHQMVLQVAGLANGTQYTFFVQGEY